MKDILDILKNKLNNLSKNKKRLLAAGLIIGSILICKSCNTDDEKNEIYLVDLTDEYENDAVLLDENNKEIKIDTKNANKLLALVNYNKTKANNMYQTIIVNEQGNMYNGYMDGKYLDDNSIDKVKINNNVLEETNVVYAPTGLWLRNEKKVNHNTNEAYCLKNSSQVATTTVFETSKDNSYQWKEAIYVLDQKIKHGYIIGDYIRNTKYSKIEGKKFTVNSSLGLKLRADSSLDSKIIETLKDGTEVILLPNVASFSDGRYDWFYVAVKVNDEIKTGYVAATYYKDNAVINYLKIKNEEKEKPLEEEMIFKVVDTAKDGNIPLKLRNKQGKDGEIISLIEDGSKVYTYQSLLNDMKKAEIIDGHKWLKVYLNNGKTGYVATSYLKNENEIYHNESNTVGVIDFDKEGKREGYFGIDVKNTIPAMEFESLIKEQVDYDSLNYLVSRDISAMTKPTFVMFRIGSSYTSTSYEHATVAIDNYTNIDNLRAMVAICEENCIPYGFYYFSQAINKTDADIEAKFIKETLAQLGTSTYHILPFATDMEEYVYVGGNSIATRILKNAEEKGKSEQTKILNYLMNKIRDDNEIEVTNYLSHTSCKNLINYEELDLNNQKNLWVVSPSSSHSNKIFTDYLDVSKNSIMWQIALDGSITQNTKIDVNLIDKDYFDNLIKENKLNKIKTHRN